MAVQILIGDCRVTLRAYPNDYFHCCVVSPPFFGARDYGVPPIIWGGLADCEHEWDAQIVIHHRGKVGDRSTLEGGAQAGKDERVEKGNHGRFCQRCGAWSGCLGLEPSIELYIAHTVEVFREVHRVLRPDGTLWLDIGDSYAGSWGNYGARIGQQRSRISAKWHKRAYEDRDSGCYGLPPTARVPGFKPKDLLGIPWRMAMALQQDGWWLRCHIPWIKFSGLPQSADDRPGVAHEHIFLLSKSQHYFYDQDAIKMPQTGGAHPRGKGITPKGSSADQKRTRANDRFHKSTAKYTEVPGGRKRRTCDWWNESLDALIEYHQANLIHLKEIRAKGGLLLDPDGEPVGLIVNPKGFKGAHYATFPPKMVEPCIKAGTSERGACPDCGGPWERVVRVSGETIGQSWHDHTADHTQGSRQTKDGVPAGTVRRKGTETYVREMLGWRPTCCCYNPLYRLYPRAKSARKRYQQDAADRWWTRVRKRPGKDEWAVVPCKVLDPCGGAGTTGLVADQLGRDAVIIDIKPEYGQMSFDRIKGDCPMFTEVTLEKG